MQVQVKVQYSKDSFQSRGACHEGMAQVGDGGELANRQLAEDGEHEVLQEAVLEHLDCGGLLSRLQRPAPVVVLHWGPHLVAHTDGFLVNWCVGRNALHALHL